jgi:Transposase DDE domain
LRLNFMYGRGGHALRTTSALAGAGGELRIAGSIAAPGKAGRYRLHLSDDPYRQRIHDLQLTTMRQGEPLGRLALKPGEGVLAGRGYPKPEGLASLMATGAEGLVRLTWKSLHLVDETGERLGWAALLAAAAEPGCIGRPVSVARPPGRFKPRKLRLVILPKPATAAERSRRTARHANRKDQHGSCDPRTLLAAGHLILLTALAPSAVPARALKHLSAVRWQIELAFKPLKAILNLANRLAKNPNLATAWLYAHLLLALIIDAIAPRPGIFPPEPGPPRQPSVWPLTAFLAALLKTTMAVSVTLSTRIACIPKLARQPRQPPPKRALQIYTIPCLS